MWDFMRFLFENSFPEELATLESIDSGAVYTLALKTHIGMSIDVWRYFAGWADKIEVNGNFQQTG